MTVGLAGLVFSWGNVAAEGYEVSKVVWFIWLVRLLSLVFIWSVVHHAQPLRNIDSFVWKVLGALLLLTTVVSIFSGQFRHSITGNFYRNDGLLTWSQLLVFGFLITQQWQSSAKELVAGSLVGAAGVLSVIILTHSSLLNRFIGHGNPSLDAGFIVMGIPFAFYLLINTKRVVWLAAVGLLVAGLIITQAWGALASLGMALIIIAILHLKNPWRWIGIGGAGLVVLSGIIGFVRHEYRPAQGDSSYYSESRVRIVTKLGLAIAKRPLGWGWANVDTAFRSVDWPYPTDHELYLDKAHSEWLEMGVTSGVVGMLLYIAFQLRVLWLAWRKIQRSPHSAWLNTIFFGLLLFVFHSQTNIVSISEQAVFWLLVGITTRIDNPTRSSYAQKAPNKKQRRA